MPVFHRGSACSLVFGLACLIGTANADPCGMVPPIYVGPGVPIARTGDQNTFVFYKNGVETFVIHPGFKGKVEQFGKYPDRLCCWRTGCRRRGIGTGDQLRQ